MSTDSTSSAREYVLALDLPEAGPALEAVGPALEASEAVAFSQQQQAVAVGAVASKSKSVANA